MTMSFELHQKNENILDRNGGDIDYHLYYCV
ncbi:unnamed protein product [Nezara viridula]|uniref:Uncharacterized protein n=1 Tax=Nezara viridula TaxID=85310 RepID=A0A9P0H2X6_NEZVI|nr:unnamed protein product [Nezara viridula]